MRLVLATIILTLCFSASYSQCEDCEYASDNLVFNGDFELGDVGFETNLLYGTGGGSGILSSGNTYAIGPDANDFHINFSGNDHTNPPDGNFMVINGTNVTEWPVWCQTLDVLPNHDYTFSFWAIDVRTNPPGAPITYGELQWGVNGTPIGELVLLTDEWQEVSVVWNSGSETSAEFCVLNMLATSNGNDYGIDDITAFGCLEYEIEQSPDAGEDLALCHGDEVSIGAEAFDNYSYSWDYNAFLQDDDVANPTISVVNTGTDPIVETFTMHTDTAGLGCLQTDEITVTIFPLPEPDLGEDLVICPGEETVLDAGPGWESVVWSTTEETQTISVADPDLYVATVTLNGCENWDDILIEQPALPEIDLGPDTSICEDGFFVFNAGITGLWSTGDMSNWIETNIEGDYHFTYEDLGCVVSDTVFLDVIQYPVIELGEDFILCPDTFAILDIGYIGQWGDGSMSEQFTVTEPGFYSVVAADQQCSVYDAITVTGLEYPEIDLGPDVQRCFGDQEVLFGSNAEQNHHYFWSTEDTTNWVDLDYTHFLTVEVSNQCGTVHDTVSVVYEDCGYDLFIPNAFTPNGDGVNETLVVHTNNFVHFEMWIFDRWGKMVFTTTDPKDEWNGDVMGGGYYAPNDTYFYRIEGQTIKKHIVRQNGWVTLIR